MGHTNPSFDNATAVHPEAPAVSNNNIDFHSVMSVNGFSSGEKINIQTTVSERPGVGKGSPEIVSVNEKVNATENGHVLPETTLNNLTLTENGKTINLNDNTMVHVGTPAHHAAHKFERSAHAGAGAHQEAKGQGAGAESPGRGQGAVPAAGGDMDKLPKNDNLPPLTLVNPHKG